MTATHRLLRRLLTKRVAAAAAAIGVAGAAGGVLAANAATAASPVAATLTASTGGGSAAAPAKPAVRAHPFLRALVRATASETGDTVKTIRQDLASGQTLNQIAGSKANAVENDVLARLKTRLDKLVAAHRITQAQEDKRLAAAKTRIEALMGMKLQAAAPHAAAATTG